MKHQAFSSSCRRLHALLSANPGEFPNVLLFIELAKPDNPQGFFPEDCSSPEALVEAVRLTLQNGQRAHANYRTGAKLYRRARYHLLRLGFFMNAQKLECYCLEILGSWRKAPRPKPPTPATAPAGAPPPPASITNAPLSSPPVLPVPPVVPVAMPPPRSRRSNRNMRLSQTQRRCAANLRALADLFFNPPPAAAHGIPIQTNALITGPTGSGKTSLVSSVAEELHAEFLHLTHGCWIVTGATEGPPTIHTILQLAANSRRSRLVLFIDELDKFALGSTAPSSWDISIRSDLWTLLDRRLSWASLAAKPEFMKTLPEHLRYASALEDLFTTKVFIVAAGTWQNLYRPEPTLGFGAQAGTPTLDASTLNRHGGLPEEVLRRFNSELLHLEYPTVAELETLMDTDGLLALGRELGQAIDPAQMHADMKLRGMGVLSSLKTSLLKEQRELSHEIDSEPEVVGLP